MPASVTTNLDDDAAVGLLHGLVAAPSVSGAEQPAVSYLVNAMRRLGLDAWVDETGNAVGCAGEGSPEIVLLGHIDTVPGDVPVRIEDGLLYGRGAVDAKGPLAAFAMAAARLQACGLLRGRIVVIGCVEEEAPSSRGAHGVLGRYHPDFCIVGEPSGVGAITLGYKGSLRARVRLTQPCAHSAHDGQSVAERGCRLWEQVRAWAGEVNRGRDRAWEQVLPALLRISSGGDGLHEWCELGLSIRLPEDFTPGIVEARLREIACAGEV
ncbi:MAG TPA: M20/M25/M40 family metallo-hydrolase [Herpetosiphonaceae bacterium]|nr:M20/M25/M40 family metallo-hydrolase [Herpetosiphonaceae bacterium]